MNIRELVLDFLLELEKEQGYSNLLLKSILDKHDYLDSRDKAFFKRLAEGCVERKIQLDYIIDSMSSVPVRKMKPLIRNLMRMSVYQILFMDSVPDSAACNEAVKLAERRKFRQLKGFVNGVLRNIARQKMQISYPDEQKEPVKALSVRYSMPEWIVEKWISDYGREKCERILDGLLQERPVTVRVKESLPREQITQWLKHLKEDGVEAKRHSYLPYAYELFHTEGVASVYGFEEGIFTVQDVSSMFVAEAAGIQAGMRILDVCAAPGGKSLHAAEKLIAKEKEGGNKGQVVSRDVSWTKVEKILENAERMGYANIQVQEWDAREPDGESVEAYDIVFADIPCSGLGITGRKNDIKYHVSEESLKELLKLQKEILTQAVRYVKPGGIFMYSTCTINRQENEETAGWLEKEAGLVPAGFSGYLPETENRLQLLPGIHKTDGFFLAKFVKREKDK